MKKIINLDKQEARSAQLYAIDTGTDWITIPNNSGIVPLLGIRLNAARHESKLSVTAFTTLSVTNDEYNYLWLLNPTFEGAPPVWLDASANVLNPGTVADVFIGDGTQRVDENNQGAKLVSGYESRRSAELNNYTGDERTIGISGGVSNELFLCVREINNAFDIFASLMRDEIL